VLLVNAEEKQPRITWTTRKLDFQYGRLQYGQVHFISVYSVSSMVSNPANSKI